MIQNKRVIVVDDSVAEAQALGQKLVRHGYFCELARSADAALSFAMRGSCDVLVCDARMALDDGCKLLDQLRRTFFALPVIIVASQGRVADAVLAMQHGAFQYLPKSIGIDDLHQHIRRAIALCKESILQRSAFDADMASGELVQESAEMKALLDDVALVARSSAPVLIVGESGTGKERIARAIHAAGPRQSGPFVAINMTAIPEQLLESELFGHARGAYTGATHARSGLFAEAEGGTLLLDEIGDMPMVLQPKILRLLQSGEIRAVGSDRSRRVDVRILAATHRDLTSLIREGTFRDDLRYRLDTLMLRVPPLRERPEDIAPLARQFLREAVARTPSSPVVAISDEAMAALQNAPWPGNIRQLESAVERMVVFGKKDTIELDALGFLAQTADRSGPEGAWPREGGRHFTLRQMNQRYLDWILEQTKGDKTRAAELLDIDVSTLYRWQRAKN